MRWLTTLLATTILLAGWQMPLAAQETPLQTTEQTDDASESKSQDIDPLLPEEGLFRAETWKGLAQRLMRNAVDYVPRLLAAIIVLVIFLILARVLSGIVTRALRRTRADPALPRIAGRLTKAVTLVVGVVMAAAQAGIAVGSLIASVGIVGLAVGLAAQDSLSNIVAGITILWDRPFRTGDRVTIAGEYGEIMDVGLRATRIRTADHRDAILPNKEVIENKIINHTRDPVLRLDVPIGIAYESDIREAREVLLEAVRGHERLAETPDPKVVVKELGDSSVNLELRVFLRDPREERPATWELLELCKLALDEAGIVIPFPQRTLHWAEGNEVRARVRDATSDSRG